MNNKSDEFDAFLSDIRHAELSRAELAQILEDTWDETFDLKRIQQVCDGWRCNKFYYDMMRHTSADFRKMVGYGKKINKRFYRGG